MEDKTIGFMKRSVAGLLLFFTIVFWLMMSVMTAFADDINCYIGNVYMMGISEAVEKHFLTIVHERVASLKRTANYAYANLGTTPAENLSKVIAEAGTYGFSHVAVIKEDNTLEPILGGAFVIEDEQGFLKEIDDGKESIRLATAEDGCLLYVVGIKTNYTNPEGKHRVTYLIAGNSTAELVDQLKLTQNKDDTSSSSIFNEEGTFVARSTQDAYTNHYDKVKGIIVKSDLGTGEEFEENLKERLAANKVTFVHMTDSSGNVLHLVYTQLADSRWYLVTGINYKKMSQGVDRIIGRWHTAILSGFTLVILVMGCFYVRMYRLFREQLEKIQISEEHARHANEVKTEFLSNVSHDIRTPMNTIVLSTRIAKENLDDKEILEKNLNNILISGRHLLGLVGGILDMTRFEEGKVDLKLENFPLTEMVRGVCTVIQNQTKAKGQSFVCYPENITSEYVRSDRTRLAQVMMNLLSNSVKYTPGKNGRVELWISEKPSGKGDAYVMLCIKIKDNGIGMNSDFLEHLYEPFTREDRKRVGTTQGVGLGMSIAKKNIDLLGGSISVESEVGRGTEFNIALDLLKADNPKTLELTGRSFLVVDEEERGGASVRDTIERLGGRAELLTELPDADAVIDRLAAARRDGVSYEAILWSERFNEMERQTALIKGILESKQLLDTQIYLITKDWLEWRDWAKPLGITKYIQKPVFPSTLYEALSPEETEEPLCEADIAYLRQKNIRILVAEDNEINWEILSMLLKKISDRVDHAENGKHCVGLFSQSPPGSCQLVLMDIRMPIMGGYSAAELIRASGRQDANVPIIAITADTLEEDIRKVFDAGMNEYVSKPINFDDLTKKIRSVL